MIRQCNGTDPNLVYDAPCTNPECPQTTGGPHTHERPCNCGKRFDDVNHLVIYPHERF